VAEEIVRICVSLRSDQVDALSHHPQGRSAWLRQLLDRMASEPFAAETPVAEITVPGGAPLQLCLSQSLLLVRQALSCIVEGQLPDHPGGPDVLRLLDASIDRVLHEEHVGRLPGPERFQSPADPAEK
jgi:hypothetical protein